MSLPRSPREGARAGAVVVAMVSVIGIFAEEAARAEHVAQEVDGEPDDRHGAQQRDGEVEDAVLVRVQRPETRTRDDEQDQGGDGKHEPLDAADAHSHGDIHADANAYTDTNLNANADSHANPHPHGDRNAEAGDHGCELYFPSIEPWGARDHDDRQPPGFERDYL